jgi:hypothetical protein
LLTRSLCIFYSVNRAGWILPHPTGLSSTFLLFQRRKFPMSAFSTSALSTNWWISTQKVPINCERSANWFWRDRASFFVFHSAGGIICKGELLSRVLVSSFQNSFGTISNLAYHHALFGAIGINSTRNACGLHYKDAWGTKRPRQDKKTAICRMASSIIKAKVYVYPKPTYLDFLFGFTWHHVHLCLYRFILRPGSLAGIS